jgi:DNA-binding CsgD family transcriptional regulator
MFFCLALPVFCYIHSMEHLLDLIRKRQSPGILIIDRNGQLRYSNQEVLVLLPNLLETDREGNPQANIPAEILRICTVAKGTTAADENDLPQDITTDCSLMVGGKEQVFSLRAFTVGGIGSNREDGYIMVLIERVVEKHTYNFEKVQNDHHLSAREMDVIKSLAQGLSNKAIAEKLYISEHTVKDHLKNIMAKMQVSSRNEILVALR